MPRPRKYPQRCALEGCCYDAEYANLCRRHRVAREAKMRLERRLHHGG